MSTAGCPALGFLQPHCGGMVPWHCTAPSLVVPVVPGIRHCPPPPEACSCPLPALPLGGATSLHWGVGPPVTPAKVQLPCLVTEGCSSKAKVGKSFQHILALQLPQRCVQLQRGRKAAEWVTQLYPCPLGGQLG